MSDLLKPTKCFLFCSCLFNQETTLVSFEEIFEKRFGMFIKFTHDFFPMKDFYSKEMGEAIHLKRVIYLSTQLFDREQIVTEKLWATHLENVNLNNGKRTLNIDVGTISLENLILATGKNFVHRIYLSDGVFADLNLIFSDNIFKPLPWTYPDYAHVDFIAFFTWARSLLLTKLKNT